MRTTALILCALVAVVMVGCTHYPPKKVTTETVRTAAPTPTPAPTVQQSRTEIQRSERKTTEPGGTTESFRRSETRKTETVPAPPPTTP
jgi:glutamate racemase